jgi:hypothetical protein
MIYSIGYQGYRHPVILGSDEANDLNSSENSPKQPHILTLNMHF